MGKKKPASEEDLVIPRQDGRICGVICICQMTCVLSAVAIVYLTVAIYMPSVREFNSGIDETPVMCTTTKTVRRDACDWVSCAEWCLSNPSGSCTQIFVNLRRNGSSLMFNNCTITVEKKCIGIDMEEAPKLRCILEQCRNLTGLFNCSDGNCTDITSTFKCTYHHADSPLKCSGRRGKVECMAMEGVYDCVTGTCKKIRSPYNCDRRCYDIPTRNKNVILISNDTALLSQCSSVTDIKEGKEVWNERDNNVLMASCYMIDNRVTTVEAIDCVNGSLLEKQDLIDDQTNFTYLNYLHYAVSKPDRKITPMEADLTISNNSALKINLEGCVNTLQDECKAFYKYFAKDGSDHNARARFPCYYAEQAVDMVVTRFNLAITEHQFMFASIVPSVLLVLSCFTLVICQKTVVVGDDAKMRIKGCDDSEALIMNEAERNDDGGNSSKAI